MIMIPTEDDMVAAYLENEESSMLIIRELPAPKNKPDSEALSHWKSRMQRVTMQAVGACIVELWVDPDA